MPITKTIYKKGSKNNVANCRPICLTSVMCKIVVRIVEKNIGQYLETASILSDVSREDGNNEDPPPNDPLDGAVPKE